MRERGGGVSAQASRRGAAPLVRRVFGHFGRLLFELLKFSGLSREQMLRRVEFEGDERVRAAHARGKGALLFTGPFRLLGDATPWRTARRCAPMRRARAPARQPAPPRLLERMRGCTGNYVIYRRGRAAPRAEGAGRERRRGHPDRPAHPGARRRDGELLRPARGDHPGAGGARPADGRAGHPGVRAAAAGRPLPARLRAPGRSARRRLAGGRSATSRSAAPTCSRCTCGASPTSGCGCTGGGATRRCPKAGTAACFRPRRARRDRSDS